LQIELVIIIIIIIIIMLPIELVTTFACTVAVLQQTKCPPLFLGVRCDVVACAHHVTLLLLFKQNAPF
jgi:hypothetical protein